MCVLTEGFRPRPALVRMTDSAMFLSADDQCVSMKMASVTTGMLRNSRPASNIPTGVTHKVNTYSHVMLGGDAAVWAVPSSGGNGGRVGSRIIPTSFPPNTEQVKRMTRPKRFPPGRHSLPVMDHTTPNSSA